MRIKINLTYKKIQALSAPILFYITLVLLLILQLLFIDNLHEWGDDWSMYLSQTRSFIDGDLDQLKLINTEMMARGKVGPNLYPMGLSLFLVPFYLIVNQLYFLKLFGIVCYIICLVVFSKILNFFIDRNDSMIISVLLGIQPFFFNLTNLIGSDIPAMMFGLIAVYNYFKIENKINVTRRNYLYFILACVLSMFIRTNYLLLVLGFITNSLVAFIYRRLSSRLLMFYFIPFVVFSILNKLFLISDGSNEINELKLLIENPLVLLKWVINNIFYYLDFLGFEFFEFTGQFKKLLILFLLVFIVLRIRKIKLAFFLTDFGKMAVINIVFFSIYIIWPFPQGTRFVLFNLFFIFAFFILLVKKYFRPVIFKSLIIALLVLGSLQLMNKIRGRIFSNPYLTSSIPGSHNSNSMFKLINDSLKSNDIVLCNKPRVVYYFTQRKSFLVNQMNLSLSKTYGKVYVLSISRSDGMIEMNKFKINNSKKNYRELAAYGELKLFEVN
jgi:hypothetical protein